MRSLGLGLVDELDEPWALMSLGPWPCCRSLVGRLGACMLGGSQVCLEKAAGGAVGREGGRQGRKEGREATIWEEM